MNENRDRIDVVIKQVFQRMKKLNPKPESCPDDQLLAAYHEGGMTREETKRIETHLLLCERCTENISLLSEVKDSYSSGKQSHATREMVQRAKDLMPPPLASPLCGRGFLSGCLSSDRFQHSPLLLVPYWCSFFQYIAYIHPTGSNPGLSVLP